MVKFKTKDIVLVAGVVLGAGFVYFSATSLVPKILVTMTKAAPATKVSLSNSYVLGAKILCKADGIDKCAVNVFLSDADGRPVPGKGVLLSAEGADVTPQNAQTDQMGKAGFTLVSKVEGQVEVKALVGGVKMEKAVTVTFRN